jgi:DNA-binding response OmpR family regulator
MPKLHLVIADLALHAAVYEQLSAAMPVELINSMGFPDPFPAEPAGLALIDASLVDEGALRILRAMRDRGGKTRIFVLGEISDGLHAERENGLVAESFPKPLRLGHLLARLQFHLQTMRAQGEPLVFGAFRLEPAGRQIVIAETGAVIRLTEKETNLLEYLGRSAHPVAREELLAAIWGYDARIDTHTLETHIYRLRRKLDPEGENATVIVASEGCYSLAAAFSR